MGIFVSKLVAYMFPNVECRTLMLGLDGAGKTTILYKLKLNETVHTIPTIGFNVETVTFQKLTLTVWDVGGQETIRPLWKYYFPNTTTLVFVVDSSDVERIEDARKELFSLLAEPELADAHLLVFANKQDLPNAKSAAQLSTLLELDSPKETALIKSETLTVDGRKFYVDLKENDRGKFLRIAQMPTNPRQTRQQITIPAGGVPQVFKVLVYYLAKFGEGHDQETVSTPKITVENKSFLFHVGKNDRGEFVRISEIKLNSGYRNAITVPMAAIADFRKELDIILSNQEN